MRISSNKISLDRQKRLDPNIDKFENSIVDEPWRKWRNDKYFHSGLDEQNENTDSYSENIAISNQKTLSTSGKLSETTFYGGKEYNYIDQNADIVLNGRDYGSISENRVNALNSFGNTSEALSSGTEYIKEIACTSAYTSSNDNSENNYAVFEIGSPELWHAINVQVFEKISTSEGKTVWNDITKEEIASVSTTQPGWANQDLSVKYRSTDWFPKEYFTLPLAKLHLLVPIQNDISLDFKRFLILPMEDVYGIEDTKQWNKRNESSSGYTSTNNYKNKRPHRHIIRSSRALQRGETDNFVVVNRGAEYFLKSPYRKRHRSQIDLEARADNNQIIRVGSSGRLTTIVSDGSRSRRSTLSLQVTNTGLTAARLRPILRECNPDLPVANGIKEINSVLLPPKFTRSFRLELPPEYSPETASCTVALVNDNDESVAVRNVKLKKEDRCFCVWHCDCVCISEDPKLLCREMTETQILAAGLTRRKQTRHIRSACYADVVSLNTFIIAIGVLIILLFLGFIKACLGLFLRCIGSWGLNRLVQLPRKMDHYYETSLRERRVVYDAEGWPVHPETKKRTVRLISKPAEFMLNMIFFVTVPCLAVCDAFKQLTSSCRAPDTSPKTENDTKKCFSSHEIQNGDGVRWRWTRRKLQTWMTPPAEELSTDVWRKGLSSQQYEFVRALLAGPLLHELCCRRKLEDLESCVVSEQEDTEYVLMQMQKSRDSLSVRKKMLQKSKRN